MNAIQPQDVISALHWRYATKRFDPTRRIAPLLWKRLEEALVLAPSSFGLQPWKFIVITDPATKQALVPHSWMQTQPADCSHHVVFCVRKGLCEVDVDRLIDRTAQLRGTPREALAGYRDVMLGSIQRAHAAGTLDGWQTHQVYIALGQFMAVAALLGVDTCPMEGIVQARYDEVLGLEGSGYASVVACAAGYRASDDKYASLAKVRFPADEVVRHVAG